MQDYISLHLFNGAPDSEPRLLAFLEGEHLASLRRLRGFKSAQTFRCSQHQLVPDARQPWTYATFYERTLAEPEIDLPALAPLLADMRDAGFVAADNAERIYSYGMYHL